MSEQANATGVHHQPVHTGAAGGSHHPPVTKVSIVIPVYNEAQTIQTLIGLVVEAELPPRIKREVICVNDCSTDGTQAQLDDLPQLFPTTDFKIVHKPVNEGKG